MLPYLIKHTPITIKKMNATPPPITAPKTKFCVFFSAMKKYLVNIKWSIIVFNLKDWSFQSRPVIYEKLSLKLDQNRERNCFNINLFN